MKNYEFRRKGTLWHLNDNRYCISKENYIFFPKYRLLEWLPDEQAWSETGYCVNTKKEAYAIIDKHIAPFLA